MRRILPTAASCLGALALVAIAATLGDGVKRDVRASEQRDAIVSQRSDYPFDETIARLKADIASKGILFFSEIDQSKLAAGAGIKLAPSTLLVFGNPPLGTLFITANPLAGLDWPVRLLVFERDGAVWLAYTDFAAIARRHGITNRDVEFKMASNVIASISASVARR